MREEPTTGTSPRQKHRKVVQFLQSHFKRVYEELEDNFLIEFRFLHPEKRPGRMFVPFKDITKCINEIFRRNNLGFNVYFGVNPRPPTQRKDATQEDIRHVCTIVADLDSEERGRKKKAPFKTITEARHALSEFSPKPSCVVNSGFGLHAYWYLQKIISVESHMMGNGLKVRQISSGIAKILRGDTVHDLCRIMRLPYTVNHSGLSKRLAKVVETTEEIFEVDDFEEPRDHELSDSTQIEVDLTDGIDQSEEFTKAKKRKEAERLARRLMAPSWVRLLIITGSIDGYPSRSERDWDIQKGLIRPYGKRKRPYDCLTIEAIFTNPYLGCSDRIREKGVTVLWNNDIPNAIKAIKEEVEKNHEEEETVDIPEDITVPDNESSAYTLAQIMEMEFPPDPQWIGRGILPKKGYLILAGDPKEGKSTLVLQMCQNLITAQPFLGFPVESPARVLYIYAEGTVQELKRIFTAQQSGLESEVDEGFLSRLVTFESRSLFLNKLDNRRTLRNLIRELEIDIVVLDPVSLFFQGNFEKTETITKFINILNRITADLGTTWIIIHHFRKPREDGNEKPMHRVMGSYSWVAFCESFLGLEQAGGRRSRNLKKLSFLLRREQSPDPMHISIDPSTRLFSISDFQGQYVTVEQIIEDLSAYEPVGIRTSEFAADCAEKYGVSETRIKQLLSMAASRRRAYKEGGKFGKWRVNPEG